MSQATEQDRAEEDRADQELEEIARALDETTESIKALEPEARMAVTSALASLDELHRRALVTVVRALREDPRGKELLFELVDDPAVRMVLGMHGIIRVPEPPPAPAPSAPTLIPLSSIRVGPPPAQPAASEPEPEPGWFETFPVDRVAEGSLEALSLQPAAGGDSVEVIVVNAGGRLSAYVNACAHQGLPLDNALVDATEATLTCPWHGFCYDAVEGECLTMPGARLVPLPLRVQDGHIWIRATGE
jgi:nitrite reductase/ring-hydroxylating ferredoxin subunit